MGWMPIENKRIFMDFLEVSPHKTADQTPDKVQEKTLSESLIPELEDGIRWRICVRLTLVAFLLSIRGVTAYFMPELFIQSKVVAVQIDPAAFHPASDLIQVRVMLLLLVLAGYLYALVAVRCFRFMAVVGMVVSCALLWSDMELFMLTTVSEITAVSFALLGMRLIAVWLLVLNYLDIHR